MAITLAEAAKYSTNDLQKGVIETIIKDSVLLQRLPFIETSGNAYAWTIEATMPSASFYAVGDTWDEATPTVTPKTETLRILGGDADVDKFILQTSPGEVANIRAEALESRAKAVKHLFMRTFFNGDDGIDPTEFVGLTKRLSSASGQEVIGDVNGLARPTTDTDRHALLDKIDEAISLVQGGPPDIMFMSTKYLMYFRGMARRLSIYDETRDEFGKMVASYAGIPIQGDDFISNTQIQGTSGGVCTSIYLARFGRSAEDGGVSGLTNGGIQVADLGELETKQALRTRISWYAGLVVHRDSAIARVKGLKTA